MRRVDAIAAMALVLACRPATVTAAGDAVILRARRIEPVTSPALAPGEILIRDGRIQAIAAEIGAEQARGARRIDVAGVITPGLIDCASDIAVVGRAAEEWSELTPEISVLDAVDFDHRELPRALEAGVTAAGVSPGGRNVLGGLGSVIRTGGRGAGPGVERVLARDAFLNLSLSDEASAGNFNLRFSRPSTYTFRIPNTRMGTVFLARRALFEALDQPDPDAVPRLLSDRGKAALREALAGKRALRVHADAVQEIDAALRLVEDAGSIPEAALQIVGGAEAAGLLPRLRAASAALILYPGTSERDFTPERFPRYSPQLAALAAAAGVPVAFASRDGDEVPRLRARAALACRLGLSPEIALRALTIDAARILRLDARLGSIEAGKDADLAAFSADPLAPTSDVLWTMTAGRIDQEKERKL